MITKINARYDACRMSDTEYITQEDMSENPSQLESEDDSDGDTNFEFEED